MRSRLRSTIKVWLPFSRTPLLDHLILTSRALILSLGVSLSLGGPLMGCAWGEEPVDYLTQIKPILKSRCFACHGGLKQDGSLRLDTGELILEGGDSGPSLIPGKSSESEILDRVSSDDEFSRMPQEGAALTELEIALLRRWIDEGAKHPDEALPLAPLEHWAFVKPRRFASGESDGSNGTSRTTIDRFLEPHHARLHLVPLERANKYTLLRRVTFDLTGLPPTPEALAAFLADDSAGAYERVVDRLLDSPRYGERWGRHWMDIWRYSDWDGFGAEVRESQPNIWRWRDWIVQSLNDDKPYDQMIVEMLAGDEFAPSDPEALSATGFLVRNYHKFNRNTWMENTVEHTGKAFLGLTFNCARCHDHKYDPIAQTEYYQWRAAFEPYNVRTDPVSGQPDTGKSGLARVYDADLNVPTYLFERGNEKHPDKEHPLTPWLPRIMGGEPLEFSPIELPISAWYPGSQAFAQRDFIAACRNRVTSTQKTLAKSESAIAILDKQQTEDDSSATSGSAASESTSQGRKLLLDRFSERDTSLWTFGKGRWEYTAHGLRQSDGAQDFCMIESKEQLPANLLARFNFTIRGGVGYRSVGLSFDLTDNNNFNAVYVSAKPGRNAFQVLHRVESADVYPPGTLRTISLDLNVPHEIQLAVRGSLVNVWLDQQLILAYELPRRRPDQGRLGLWTLDAVADFRQIIVQQLSDEFEMVAAQDDASHAKDKPVDLTNQRKQLIHSRDMALADLSTAQAKLVFAEARVAADNARYAVPSAANAGKLTKLAIDAQRESQLATARRSLLKAAHARQQKPNSTGKALEKLDNAIASADKTVRELELPSTEAVMDYSPLGDLYPKTSTGRRTALARHIADESNPLTARVAVNHIWLRHFGTTFVPSVFDFGHNGKRPTHRALLDELAVELMESGWRMKPMHRLIVTSAAYQRKSIEGPHSAKNREIDRDNVYLWRMFPRRLEAEAVRDAVLMIDGRLDLTMGGPDLSPDASTPRRSIYFRHAKEKRVEFLAIFDQGDVTECYRRSETIVPQQALAMANSKLIARSGELAAEALEQQLGDQANDKRFIAAAFLKILSRPATKDELRLCLEFIAQHASQSGPPVRQRLIYTLLNHHDFVTLR